MKKLLSISLLSILLFSCKQETKKVTQHNKATGKMETIEVSVEDKEEIVENLAIKDSAGVFTHQFILEKGKTYPIVSYQKENTSITDPTGKSKGMIQESTDEMSFTVDAIENNIYNITINLIGKRTSNQAEGKSIIIDTKLPAPKETQLIPMWTVNKAFSGSKLQMKMDQKGKIISITGFDTVYNKINSAVTSIVKDANQRKGFLENLKKSFNENSLKEQFAKNLMIIPKNGAKIGQKWSDSENLNPDGSIKMTTNYTLQNVENGFATIKIDGGIPKKTQSKTEQGITRSMSLDAVQNGNIKMDAKSGWIYNTNLQVKTTQKETLSQGSKSQSMVQTNQSSVMINPSNK